MNADDRLPLGGGWALWRQFVVRGAGFPFADLDEALSAGRDAGPAARLAGSEDLRRALMWQNPAVLTLAVDWLAAHAADPGRNRRRRDAEHAVVKYLQRYHTKNESVGFFGPVAWGSFATAPAEPVVVRPGVSTDAARRVYIEDWAVDAVGRAFAADPAIGAQLPLALAFGVARIGRALTRPGGTMRRLNAGEAEAVRLVDGARTVAAIADVLGLSAAEVDQTAAELLAEGLLTRGFNVPPELRAEETLAAALRALEPVAAVTRALATLADLEAARGDVERAESSEDLAKAFAAFDERFAAVAGADPTRSREQAAIGRRPLVTQSRRDVEVRFGDAVAERLAAPLTLVLASARWLSRRAGEEFEKVAAGVLAEMAPLFAENAVPLSALCSRLLPLTMPGRWLDALVADLEQRWLGVLDLSTEEFAASRVTRTAAELRAGVEEAFAGPAPGFHAGRHHSPDVMLAADGVEALERGEYEFVLGEVHVAMVTANSQTFLDFAPDPDLVRRCGDRELVAGQPRFVPLHIRTSMPPASGWDYPPPDAFSPEYVYLSFGEGLGERAVPGGRKVAAEDVLVGTAAGRPVAVLPDGARHPLLQVLGEYVTYALVSRFRMLPARPHTPRITVDGLTVVRETWRIPFGALEGLAALPEAEVYDAFLAVAAEYGLPRHTFWRAMPGVKPIFLDLERPLLVAVLARELRRAAGMSEAVVFGEMHPGPERLWLPDARGRRYTSELRLTIADTTAPEAGGVGA